MSLKDGTRIEQHDVVVLLRPVPEHRLKPGDMGVVIDIGVGADDAADEYLLEIFAAGGATLGLVSVAADWVRLARNDEAPTVRPVAAE
jgi:hypothetical protein